MTDDDKKIITLDLVVGYQVYLAAMNSMLERIKENVEYQKSNRPPEEIANLMATETFAYLQGLLPGMAIGEATSLFAAVIGLAFAAHLKDGVLEMAQVENLEACFVVALEEAIPRALKAFKAFEDQKPKVH